MDAAAPTTPTAHQDQTRSPSARDPSYFLPFLVLAEGLLVLTYDDSREVSRLSGKEQALRCVTARLRQTVDRVLGVFAVFLFAFLCFLLGSPYNINSALAHNIT